MNNVMGKTGKNIEKVLDVPDPVTNSSMIAVISRVAGVEVDTYDAQIAALIEKGIMTDEILQHMGAENDTPMVAEAAMLVANLYQYHTGQV